MDVDVGLPVRQPARFPFNNLKMQRYSVAYATPVSGPRWKRLAIYSPMARIAIFAALTLLLTLPSVAFFRFVGWSDAAASSVAGSFAQLVTRAMPAMLAYLILVRFIERRALRELAPKGLLISVGKGILAGTVFLSAIVVALWASGSYRILGTDPQAPWLPAVLLIGLGAAISEEIAFRGVLFRVVEEGLGTWTSLLVSAVFFGLAHAHNPSATIWSSIAISIEAGLLIGLVYHLTRSLWVCMGLHAAWNLVEGLVYGIPVSGMPIHGWLISRRDGPNWLSGGIFGAEASVVALALSLACSIILMLVVVRRGSIVPFPLVVRDGAILRRPAIAPRLSVFRQSPR